MFEVDARRANNAAGGALEDSVRALFSSNFTPHPATIYQCSSVHPVRRCCSIIKVSAYVRSPHPHLPLSFPRSALLSYDLLLRLSNTRPDQRRSSLCLLDILDEGDSEHLRSVDCRCWGFIIRLRCVRSIQVCDVGLGHALEYACSWLRIHRFTLSLPSATVSRA